MNNTTITIDNGWVVLTQEQKGGLNIIVLDEQMIDKILQIIYKFKLIKENI